MANSRGDDSLLLAFIRQPFTVLYILLQRVLEYIFAPAPPPLSERREKLHRPRIAVIGAGLTGISSAAHCVGHGFDVKIFEARPRDKGLGGIWSVWFLLSPTSFHKAWLTMV